MTIANACIDISDGLTADLGHILKASGVGARIQESAIPISSALRESGFDPAAILQHALHGGDDYELCFTVPTAKLQQLESLRNKLDCPIIEIGEITQTPGLQLVSASGDEISIMPQGFQHF